MSRNDQVNYLQHADETDEIKKEFWLTELIVEQPDRTRNKQRAAFGFDLQYFTRCR
jgi:hypothetical protein